MKYAIWSYYFEGCSQHLLVNPEKVYSRLRQIFVKKTSLCSYEKYCFTFSFKYIINILNLCYLVLLLRGVSRISANIEDRAFCDLLTIMSRSPAIDGVLPESTFDNHITATWDDFFFSFYTENVLYFSSSLQFFIVTKVLKLLFLRDH